MRTSVRRFDVIRAWRPKPFVVGVAVLIGTGIAGVILALELGAAAERFLPMLVIPGFIGFFAGLVVAMARRAATLELADGVVHASWRRRPLTVREVRVGRLVLAHISTPTGLVAHLHGDEGRMRLAAYDHDGEQWDLDGPPARSAEVTLAPDDLDALLVALGARAAIPGGEVVVELVPNNQTFLRSLGGMAPWFSTIVLVSVFGIAIGLTQRDDLLAEPAGRALATAITVVLILGGITATIVRARRIRKPLLGLRLGHARLSLVRLRDGHTLAEAEWYAVHATPKRHVVRTRSFSLTLGALELALGEHRPLRCGTWDGRDAWPHEVPRGRSPRWLTGRAQWLKLVAALRRHHRL